MSEKKADVIDRRWGVDPESEARLDAFLAQTQPAAPIKLVDPRLVFEAIDRVAAQYPIDIFPEGGTSQDAKSASWARRVVGLVRKEVEEALGGGENQATDDGAGDPREGPMHGWFGLSYSSYLVLPRVVLQSMPITWQRALVQLLETARERCAAAGVQVADNYYVKVRGPDGQLVDDDLPRYRRAPLLGDPRWADAHRPLPDPDDPVDRASTEAFAKTIELIEVLPAADSGEAMRAAVLQAISDHAGMPLTAEPDESREEVREAIAAMRAPPPVSLDRPRIKVLPVEPLSTGEAPAFVDGPGAHGVAMMPTATYPQSPRGEAIRDFRRTYELKLGDVARALCIGSADLSGIERGSKTTDQAGWEEIQTVMFRLASEPKEKRAEQAGYIANPWSNPAIDRILAAEEEQPEGFPNPGAGFVRGLATPPPDHSSEPGDVCGACSDVLGSPSPCALTHDFAPGAYPPPKPDIEPLGGFDVERRADTNVTGNPVRSWGAIGPAASPPSEPDIDPAVGDEPR